MLLRPGIWISFWAYVFLVLLILSGLARSAPASAAVKGIWPMQVLCVLGASFFVTCIAWVFSRPAMVTGRPLLGLSWRDLCLIFGGLCLWAAAMGIWRSTAHHRADPIWGSFVATVLGVGVADHPEVMIAALVAALGLTAVIAWRWPRALRRISGMAWLLPISMVVVGLGLMLFAVHMPLLRDWVAVGICGAALLCGIIGFRYRSG